MRQMLFSVTLVLLFALAAAAQSVDHAPLALSLVNDARADEGLDPLKIDATLADAAQVHADDMLARDFYSHTGPDGDDVQDRVIEAGGSRWRIHAENIARCQNCEAADADQVRAFHSGWMQSPGHRKNILRDGLDDFGFGIASGDGVIHAVQVFGGPGTAPGRETGNAADPASPEAVRDAAMEALKALEDAGQPKLEMSDDLNAAALNLAERAALTDGELSLPSDPYSLLPDNSEGWTQLALRAKVCGGCGAYPVSSDGAYFAERLGPQSTGDFSHVGFALVANGKGQKIAVAVYGVR